MIEEHVHCGQCMKPIATTVIVKGGKRKPVEVKGGMQLRPVPAPGGGGEVTFIPVMVPLCAECSDAVEKAQAEAKTRSKLVVPGMSAEQRAALRGAAGTGIHLVEG